MWTVNLFNAVAQRPQLIFSCVAFLAIFALVWSKRLPSIQGLIDCANVLNTKGGNLLLLAMMSGWFFWEALKLNYHLIYMVSNHQITADNAIALQGITFVTGTAFGGAFGAFLKGMSGEALTSTSASSVETKQTVTQTVVTPPTEPEALAVPAVPPPTKAV